MRSIFRSITLSLAILSMALLSGCSDSNPVSAFQPEIINNTDAFEFQITSARNVTTVLSYTWTNTGSQASIDHSTATVDGTGTVILSDGHGTEVYSSSLKASGTEQSSSGASGAWTIVITFSDFDGTSNFRVQKL